MHTNSDGSNDAIERLRYFKGQVLTARDFEDQQTYHREKLTQFVQRFPPGIIRGLDVRCTMEQDENGSFVALKISEGFAVDGLGRALIVSASGISVRADSFEQHLNEPFLSLEVVEEEVSVCHAACDPPVKYNRVRETVGIKWDTIPNRTDDEDKIIRITVAKIRHRTSTDPEPEENDQCPDLFIEQEDRPGQPRIRINASLINTDQIANQAVTKEKIRDGAVTAEKLASGIELPVDIIKQENIDENAVITSKIANGAVISEKIRKADGIPFDAGELQGDERWGIHTDHIRDRAVDNEKIDYDAIESEHIKDGAIISGKIGKADGTTWEDGDLNDDETGIRAEHLQDSIVQTAHIRKADDTPWEDGELDDGETGIRVEQIQNGTISSNKLALNVDQEVGGTIAAGVVNEEFVWPTTLTDADLNKPMMGYVIPAFDVDNNIGGDLSWRMGIRRSSDTDFNVVFWITNHDADNPAEFEVRLLSIS